MILLKLRVQLVYKMVLICRYDKKLICKKLFKLGGKY